MSDKQMINERELDMLVQEVPQFDLTRVKEKTFARIAPPTPKRRISLRGLLLAAVICTISISTLTTADYVAGGRILKALGILPVQEEVISPPPEIEEPDAITPPPVIVPSVEAPPTPDEVPSEDEPITEAPLIEEPVVPIEQPVKREPPSLSLLLADAFGLNEALSEQLRPAAQDVLLTAEENGTKMTVLQTLGDESCLYITVRFDFPKKVSAEAGLVFEDSDIDLHSAGGYSSNYRMLASSENSATYLFELYALDSLEPNGQTITLSFENYGRKRDLPRKHIQLKFDADEARTVIIDTQGNINATATAEDITAIPSISASVEHPGSGFTVERYIDGTLTASYDGMYGEQYLTLLTGDPTGILVGENPRFETLLAGKWSQTWQLDYEDTSLCWNGLATAFDPSLTMTEVRLSPFSWSAHFSDYVQARTVGLPKEWVTELRYADGSTLPLTLQRTSSGGLNSTGVLSMVTGGYFDQPLDLANSVAIIIDGTEFPLN